MEIVLFISSLALSIGYVYLLHWIINGWDDTVEWEIPSNYTPKTKVTILVAARNEEEHIKACIESILANNYPTPLLEILIMDDHSEDATATIVKAFENEVLSKISVKGEGGKKTAIAQGVAASRGTLIICTDADSVVPPTWISGIVSYYESYSPTVMTGLIEYDVKNTALQKFQYFDCLNNMAVTAAGIHYQSHYLANGANYAFEKSFFEQKNGYQSNASFASGDDVFLMQQAANKENSSVAFIKSKQTIVKTQPVDKLNALVSQRKRWASKSRAYPDKGIIYIQGYVFILILVLIANALYIPFGTGLSFFTIIFMLFIKWIMDYLHLSKIANYFEREKPMKLFFSASFLFILYILYAGFIAIFPSKYKWKGRKAN